MIVIVSEREMKGGGESEREKETGRERERERLGECDIKSQHKM